MTKSEVVEAVKAHALANYNAGGWDVIVEAWTDEDIASAIGAARTLKGAIKKLAPVIDVYSERQADAVISAGEEQGREAAPADEPAGDTWVCGWLIEAGRHPEDGETIIRECQARAFATDTGWACEAGHEHVTAEVRVREGWDYASDEGEAAQLAKYGTEPVQMDGKVWVW
jgi:hypothetical protein